jgi:hypothetical protein
MFAKRKKKKGFAGFHFNLCVALCCVLGMCLAIVCGAADVGDILSSFVAGNVRYFTCSKVDGFFA